MMQSNLGHLLQGAGQLDESPTASGNCHLGEETGSYSRQLSKPPTNLADVLWTKGDDASAANLFRGALSIDQSLFGPKVGADLTNFGTLLKGTGAATEADSVLRRALAIFVEIAGPSSQEANYARETLRRR
jgi:hypothetical protein